MIETIIILSILLIPIHVFAATGEGAGDSYISMNLEETLKDEGINKAFSNYQETDEQITIYLFRGKGCSFCNAFLNYLNSITNEYGKYFKLISYEVWSNQQNSNLMNEVSTFLGQPADGIPYIIIGEQVFAGYSEEFNEGIESAIMNLYSSEKRYDVFEEMKKAEKANNSKTSSTTVIIWNLVFIIIATSIILIFINNKDKKLNAKLDEIEKKINISTNKKQEK